MTQAATSAEIGGMRPFEWPADQGWPYGDDDDAEDALADPRSAEDDPFALEAKREVDVGLDHLAPFERQVVAARFGLAGEPACTMRELHRRTGMPADELHVTLQHALSKLRAGIHLG